MLSSEIINNMMIINSAHDIATSRQHRSVSASDVIRALEIIQFGDMVPGLQEELES